VTPSSQSVEVTHTATFTTIVRGVGNKSFTYQWRKGYHHKPINGKTEPILKFDKVSQRNEGQYSCYVENMYGDFAISNTVQLTITSNYFSIIITIIVYVCQ